VTVARHRFLFALLIVSATSGTNVASAQGAAPHWSLADAQALLAYIEAADREGLIPADYRPHDLARVLSGGEGPALDAAADSSFSALVEDLRDGRTPVDDRGAWYVDDEDAVRDPTDAVLTRALRSHDIAGALAALDPAVPDYAALKAELAAAPASDARGRALIRVNMDRWRWFPRDLGTQYLLVNVPEFALRQVEDDVIVRRYRVIVGKPGETATPILAEKIAAVIVNPVWTVPEPIVDGEGLGKRLLAQPAAARARGYVVNRKRDGTLEVTQKPGPMNMLGKIKFDMPNAYGIYLHDTPSKDLFERAVPALSHGCIRVQGAVDLANRLATSRTGNALRDIASLATAGEQRRIELARPMPIYTAYFTVTKTRDGPLLAHPDIYGWDGAVMASFERPRLPRSEERAP